MLEDVGVVRRCRFSGVERSNSRGKDMVARIQTAGMIETRDRDSLADRLDRDLKNSANQECDDSRREAGSWTRCPVILGYLSWQISEVKDQE
jgi:hypothetical protein